MKAIAGVLAIFITTPIWFYILYQLLVGINASELTWFLFWVYVPVGILVSSLTKLAEKGK